MAKKTRYSIIKTYTNSDFKNRVTDYCNKSGKSESRVVQEALVKLINGDKK